MSYDPRCDGAQCDRCPLGPNGPLRGKGEFRPVETEWHGSDVMLLGAYPGAEERAEGKPQVGKSGQLLMRTLRSLGVRRSQVNIGNVLSCVPEPDYKKLEAALRRINRKLPDEEKWPHPVECCRPRLKDELARVDKVVALGTLATEAVVPGSAAARVQGNLVTVANPGAPDRQVRVIPTYNPAAVLYRGRWRDPFRRSLERAVRWFNGDLRWEEPKTFLVNPTYEQALKFVQWLETQPCASYDTETDSIESLECNLRTIQIGTADHVCVIQFLSIDGITRFYSPDEEQRLRQLVYYALCQSKIVWMGWNAAVYDRTVMEEVLGRWFPWMPIEQRTPKLAFDGMAGHSLVYSELPHGLDFAGAQLTDVHAWKADKASVLAESDADLCRYGGLDTIVTARVCLPILQRVQETEQLAALDGVHGMMEVCAGLHRSGMFVDQNERLRLLDKYTTLEAEAIEQVFAALRTLHAERGDLGYFLEVVNHGTKSEPNEGPRFNPNSPPQLGTLLFEKLGLTPPQGLKPDEIYTETGERSTGDLVLRAYLCDATVPRNVKMLIGALRRVRKARKLIGDKLLPARMLPQSAYGWAGAPPRKLRADGTQGKPIVATWKDGRIRTGWNAHTTVVGRLASSQPMNLQNVKKTLRTMFVPQFGNVYVGADWSSLHLRIIAGLWGIPSLIDAYSKGLDAHQLLTEVVFGDRFRNAEGWPHQLDPSGQTPLGEWWGHAGDMRSLVKTLRYAGAYGASAETIHGVLTKAENDDGSLANAKLTLWQVQKMLEAWMGAEPEWQEGWKQEVELFEAQGYLSDLILGRRCYFTDQDDDRNKLINYRVLSTEAALATVAFTRLHRALAALRQEHPDLGPGLVNISHDSCVVEVREPYGERVRQLVEQCMNLSMSTLVPHLPNADRYPLFKAGARIGMTWKSVN